MDPSSGPRGRVRFGTFDLDPGSAELRRAGVPVRLQAQPASVLVLLVERAGALVSREEIGRRLWGDRWEEFDPGINTCISQIRAALGDNAASPVYVATVPRRGYRFVAPVERLRPADAIETTGQTLPGAARGAVWPVATAAALVLAAFAILAAVSRAGAPAPAEDPRVMLAVLPFETMDADSSIDYVSAGLTEELITLLANVDPARLGVIARTSSAAAARSGAPVDRIGRTLGVDYVIEGALRRGTDEVRITAQLIRVSDQSHVWADTYDRAIDDVLEVQREVARRVTGALAVRLAPGPAAPAGTTESPAWLPTAEARWLADRGETERAIELTDQAIAADSTFAPAWTARASILVRAGETGGARAAAQRAIALDDSDAIAHLRLASILFLADWDRDAAEYEFRRALELAPGRAELHHSRALFLVATGRPDAALASIEEAMRLDPVSTLVIGDAAFIAYLARDYALAERYATRVLELDPTSLNALTQLVHIDAVQGRTGGVVRHGLALGRLVNPESPPTATPDTVAAARAFWQAWVRWWRANASTPAAAIPAATGFVHLGEPDSAMAELRRGFEAHGTAYAFLGADPAFDPLRGDPAFDAILRAIGLMDPETGGR